MGVQRVADPLLGCGAKPHWGTWVGLRMSNTETPKVRGTPRTVLRSSMRRISPLLPLAGLPTASPDGLRLCLRL